MPFSAPSADLVAIAAILLAFGLIVGSLTLIGLGGFGLIVGGSIAVAAGSKA